MNGPKHYVVYGISYPRLTQRWVVRTCSSLDKAVSFAISCNRTMFSIENGDTDPSALLLLDGTVSCRNDLKNNKKLDYTVEMYQE